MTHILILLTLALLPAFLMYTEKIEEPGDVTMNMWVVCLGMHCVRQMCMYTVHMSVCVHV